MSRTRLPEPSEADIQSVCVEGLAWMGRVLRTNENRKRCRSCGEFSHAGSGIDKGLGDVLFRRDHWPRALWLMTDIKREKGWRYSSPEQRENAESGGLILIHSWEEMQREVTAMDAILQRLTRPSG